MKKSLHFPIVGLVIGILFWYLSANTILFDAMERKLIDGFFYLREHDALELATGAATNQYVSNRIQLMAIDNKSLGVLGKWPWYRDVHARYLEIIQKFSPGIVYFDIFFIMPEKMPASLQTRLRNEPEKLNDITFAFREMDNFFARALEKYDNVYIDLFLVGEETPDSPYLDRILQTENLMIDMSIPAGDDEPTYYFSMEPLVESFMANAQPVTVNQWPDKDEVIRSFLAVHSYKTNQEGKRYLFSAVLTFLMEYYYIDSRESVLIEPERIVLRSARAPELNLSHQPRVHAALDFAEIRNKTTMPPATGRYNRNIYNHIVNEFSLERPDDAKKIPPWPIHLLKKDDNNYELLQGREVFDAAAALNSTAIDVIFYTEKDIVINTEANFAGVTHVFPINFAGRQEIPYQDPESGKRKIYTPIPTASYLDIIDIGEIPDLPLVTGNGRIDPDYPDWKKLEKWFKGYTEKKNNEALLACQGKYQDLTMENVMRYIADDDPETGRFVLYKMFFDDIAALIEAGELPAPATFEETLLLYPEWLAGNGLQQEESLLLNLQQAVLALQDSYTTYLNRYYEKFIFTGAYSAGMADDIKITPYGSMFGVNVITSAFNTIVTDNQLSKSPDRLNTILLLALCTVLALIYGPINIRINFYIFIFFFLAIFMVSFLLFSFHNFILKTSPLVLANLAVFLTITVIKVLTEEKDKKFLKQTFAQYISPELIDTMYENKAHPQLGGTTDIITAYFTDIQSFSTFSEKLTAQHLVELLNEYLTVMTDTLMEEQGTLDKYEGDAIVAFFGAPMRFTDNALRACRAAIQMQKNLLKLREKWQQDKSDEDRNIKKLPPGEWTPGDKWPRIVHEMKMRIGINTGEIVIGNMGSRTRMNYTMMGDSVNLAARLEAGAKQYGVYTMISEATYHHEFEMEGDTFRVSDFVEARLIDNITVVGKSEPVKVYELVAQKGDLTEEQEKLFILFNKGIQFYLAMLWEEAMAEFTEALRYEMFPDGKTTPSKVYINRCREFMENPPVAPGEEWDGVYRLTSK